jgi:hypothetical protein
MSRKILLFAIMITLLAMFHQPPTIRAEDHRTITITGVQMSNVFRAAPFSQPFTTEPIKYRELGVVKGQLMIFFTSQQPLRNAVERQYYIWLDPTLHDGKISCTIAQIRVDRKLYTRKDLIQPNPYFSDLNGDVYCNSFLPPFLVGYGPDTRITGMTLKPRMLILDLIGTLSPNAPNPIVVGGCRLIGPSHWLKLRTGPGREYSVIDVIKSFDNQALVLDWRGDWLKISYKGTVGWIGKYYARGTGSCIPDYSNSSEAWLRSDAP